MVLEGNAAPRCVRPHLGVQSAGRGMGALEAGGRRGLRAFDFADQRFQFLIDEVSERGAQDFVKRSFARLVFRASTQIAPFVAGGHGFRSWRVDARIRNPTRVVAIVLNAVFVVAVLHVVDGGLVPTAPHHGSGQQQRSSQQPRGLSCCLCNEL